MRAGDLAQVEAWERLKRIAIIGCLVLSAIQTWGLAIVISLLGSGEGAKLLTAGLLLFGGLALAVAFGFRKVQAPTWKHWLFVSVLATPGALAILSR